MVHNYHVYTQLSCFFLHHPVNSKTTCTSLSLILDMVTWGGNTFLPLETVHMISHQSQLLGAFRQSSDNAIESSVNQDLGFFHAVLVKIWNGGGGVWPIWDCYLTMYILVHRCISNQCICWIRPFFQMSQRFCVWPMHAGYSWHLYIYAVYEFRGITYNCNTDRYLMTVESKRDTVVYTLP